MGHKKVCFTCRKAFSLYVYEAKSVNLTCPECGLDTILLNHKFRPPKRDDLKQWQLARFLVDNGFLFQHVYNKNNLLIPYPNNMEDAKNFVIDNKRQVHQ